MPRLKQSLAPAVTTTTTVSVGLSPKARTMIKTRCEEYAKLAAEKKVIEARQKAIGGELETLFMKEKQGAALVDGCDIDGHKLKLVTGVTRKLDEVALMKAHGISAEELAEFRDEKPKKAYVSIKAPGAKDEEE